MNKKIFQGDPYLRFDPVARETGRCRRCFGLISEHIESLDCINNARESRSHAAIKLQVRIARILQLRADLISMMNTVESRFGK